MGKKKHRVLPSDLEIKYWLLDQSNRLHCWIVESQIEDIISESQYIELDDVTREPKLTLNYTYSAQVEQDNLISLVEEQSGTYAIIRNNVIKITEFDSDSSSDSSSKESKEKPKERIESHITRSDDLKEILKNLTSVERKRLNILPVKSMKIKQEIKERWSERFPILFKEKEKEQWISWVNKQKEHLDLVGCFWVKQETFDGQVFNQTSLTLNQNYQLNDFQWLSSFKNLSNLTLVNMPHLTNEDIESICQNAPQLTDFTLHYCPKVNLRLILPLIKLKNLAGICLNQIDLVCQLNAYSGVIGEDEWVPAPQVTRVLISSNNLTMDVCDQILANFTGLDRLVIHPKVFVSLKQNLKEYTDPGIHNTELTIASLDRQEWKIRRPFKIENQLKEKYDSPYSESMMTKIKEITDDEDLENDPELLAEVIAELKANGEWSE